MWPLIQPAKIPFSLPKWKGNRFEDHFTFDRAGILPSEWADVVSGITIANPGRLERPQNSTRYIAKINYNFGNAFYVEAIIDKPYDVADITNEFAGVLFGWAGVTDSRVAYQVGLHNEQGFILQRINSSDEGVTTLAQDVSITTGPRKVGIYRNNNNGSIIVYLDGAKKFSITDTTYSNSYIGVHGRAGVWKNFRAVRL